MTAEDENPKQPFAASYFYMWRALLAIAWVDGSCGKEETEYFAKVFDNLDRYFALTQEQRDALANALETPEEPWGLVSHINDPEVQGTLVQFADDLVMLDGVLDPSEEQILDRLHSWYHPSYDKEQLRGEMRKVIADARAQREKEKQELRQQIRHMSPLYNAVDRLCLALGIDLIE